MNLRQIEAFRAVVEDGSFSAAARRLRVSQPTVSKAVAGLERTLGHRLFQRSGGRATPTAEALAFYREVARAWRGIERLSSVARAPSAPDSGRIVVGANPTLASGFIQKIVARFLAVRPKVQLALECDNGRNLVEGVLAGTIDIGFATRTTEGRGPSPGTLPSEPIFRGESVCVLPPGHPLATRRAVSAADLAGVPFIGLSTVQEARRALDAAFDRAGVVPLLAAEASTPTAACLLAAEGVGATIVSDLAAWAAAQVSGRPPTIRRLRPALAYTIDFAMSRAGRESALVEAFCGTAREAAAEIHGELAAAAGARCA